MRRLAFLLALAVAVLAGSLTTPTRAVAAPPPPAASGGVLRGNLDVHDPALVTGAPGQKWYVFSSGKVGVGGGTIDFRSSADNGRTWTYGGTIWNALPAWAHDMVPGATNMWAPAVHFHAGTYYLYYAISTVGHNDSVIGLATNTTLDPATPGYKWVDQGKVVRSLPASDFNAIDPEVVEDGVGTPWLVFGSFWTGIQMVSLEWPTGKRSADKTRFHIADRKVPFNAIEAPSITRHGGWYYLMTSWDKCCLGTNSTYRIVVGRSKTVTGPYVDRDGKALSDGGGTTLLTTTGSRIGPGGESVSGGVVAYHYYDATNHGLPKLGLRRLTWTADGWPQIPPGDFLGNPAPAPAAPRPAASPARTAAPTPAPATPAPAAPQAPTPHVPAGTAA